jgi:hypothetical protein
MRIDPPTERHRIKAAERIIIPQSKEILLRMALSLLSPKIAGGFSFPVGYRKKPL